MTTNGITNVKVTDMVEVIAIFINLFYDVPASHVTSACTIPAAPATQLKVHVKALLFAHV